MGWNTCIFGVRLKSLNLFVCLIIFNITKIKTIKAKLTVSENGLLYSVIFYTDDYILNIYELTIHVFSNILLLQICVIYYEYIL